ncbi:MAG TPA: histidinol dehydrogenase [Nitrososphaerales archaeon]|nr:histidinol dehydrogenase [Nitrososphaerales archaeon]
MRSKKQIRILDFKDVKINEGLPDLRAKEAIPSKVDRIARRIIINVKKDGNKALFEYTLKLDSVKLTKDTLKISDNEIRDAYLKVTKKQISAINFAKRKIERFEKSIINNMKPQSIQEKGVNINQSIIPVEQVGCYVPGGDAIYVSSLLMTVLPAKVAGVNRIVVTSPPSKNGDIPPLLLVAADICGVDEFYKIGGAQAIAALAYGTESLKSVDKIVGPGNIYVTAAKLIVSNIVGIDIPAGPSELLILADKSANANFVARDLISQAEHRHDSIAGLVTDSPNLIKKVTKVLNEYLQQLTRGEIISNSFFTNGFIILCKDRHQMINFANIFAAEHLEIITNHPKNIVNKITSAGLILLGPYSPSAATDYCVGTNHVLPTSKFARSSSGLSSLDFVKQVNVVECSKLGLNNLRKHISVLALSEGLSNHKLAVEERFRAETN